MDINGENKWSDCFEVTGVHLPTGYYLGLSAATGDLVGKCPPPFCFIKASVVFTRVMRFHGDLGG